MHQVQLKPMIDHRRLRLGYIELILSISPNWVVGLECGLSIRPDTFNEQVARFFNVIQRKGRGRNWAKYPAEKWPRAIGFLEHPYTNPHMHLAVYAPVDLRFTFDNGEAVWRSIRRSGAYHADMVEDRHKYARYITKDFYLPSTREEPFIYARSGLSSECSE